MGNGILQGGHRGRKLVIKPNVLQGAYSLLFRVLTTIFLLLKLTGKERQIPGLEDGGSSPSAIAIGDHAQGPSHGRVAQMDRTPDYESGSRGFESLRDRQPPGTILNHV